MCLLITNALGPKRSGNAVRENSTAIILDQQTYFNFRRVCKKKGLAHRLTDDSVSPKDATDDSVSPKDATDLEKVTMM